MSYAHAVYNFEQTDSQAESKLPLDSESVS